MPRDPSLGESFQVRVEHQGTTALVRLSGAFAAECEKQFEELLERVEKAQLACLILDLRGLTFIDSTALRMVLLTQDRVRRADLGFAIVRGRGQVRRAFKLADLDQKLPMVDDPSAVIGGQL